MITTRHVVLVCEDKDLISHLEHFEALTFLKGRRINGNAKKVWSYNKTPVVTHIDDAENFDCVEFPYDLVHVDGPYGKGNFLTDAQVKVITKWCHDKDFEPGEYDCGRVINTRSESCILCQIAQHKAISPDTADYNREVEKEVDCIIYESARFYVCVELGALKPGYLMIIPKSHEYLSIAQIDEKHVWQEYLQVCRDVEYILKHAFGTHKPVSFFEHGSNPSGLSSHPKSIVHAHTHVVFDWCLDEHYIKMIQMKQLDDLTKAAHNHYFAYKVGWNGTRYCTYDPAVFVQRQFPRQVMASEIGYAPSQYNWRKNAFNGNVHATLFRIWKYLAKNQDNLPPHIRRNTMDFVIGYHQRADFHE